MARDPATIEEGFKEFSWLTGQPYEELRPYQSARNCRAGFSAMSSLRARVWRRGRGSGTCKGEDAACVHSLALAVHERDEQLRVDKALLELRDGVNSGGIETVRLRLRWQGC